MRRMVEPLVQDLHDPVAAAKLLLRGYRPETQRGYMTKCRAFFRYCQAHNRAPLPASVPTMIGFRPYHTYMPSECFFRCKGPQTHTQLPFLALQTHTLSMRRQLIILNTISE